AEMSARIAIIGAGIAGLAAGRQCRKAGLAATIFEKDPSPGGRMSSEEVDGFLIEKAAYTFPEFHRNLTACLGETGIADSLTATPGTSSTFIAGGEYRIKIGSPTDFLRYKLLSLKNKKDMIKLFLYAQSLGNALNLAEPGTKTFELEKESAADYLLEHYDREILEYIAYPIFCEIFLGTPEDNSKAAFLATLKNLTRFKIFSFSHGMGMLPERLSRDLDVRPATPVLQVVPQSDDGPYRVHYGGDHPGSESFDAVIFAIPSPLVPTILDGLSADLKNHFLGVRYSPSVVVALALDERIENTSMINNLGREDFKTVGTLVFDHHKGPNRMPEGKGLATAILCEPASRAMLDASDEAVVTEVLRDVERIFPGLSGKVIFSRVYRWEHGAVQLPPGALFKQRAARDAIEGSFAHIAFAGDGLYKSSLEVSFNTGMSAANRIIEKFGSRA
ncbi:MAG: NAD(P)/FAD-dependent oxidoreductase, partial [Pseudomonadota bacterium]